MQVSVDKVKSFQPVEIKIILESEEELKALRGLAGFDNTVANTVFKFDVDASETLCEILGTLYDEIRNV